MADTLCARREIVEGQSGDTFVMASAIGEVRRVTERFDVVVQEHRDGRGAIVKYSITLLDGSGTQRRAWHLSRGRGQHQHTFTKGRKDSGHVPHEGTIEGIAGEMVTIIRSGA